MVMRLSVVMSNLWWGCGWLHGGRKTSQNDNGLPPPRPLPEGGCNGLPPPPSWPLSFLGFFGVGTASWCSVEGCAHMVMLLGVMMSNLWQGAQFPVPWYLSPGMTMTSGRGAQFPVLWYLCATGFIRIGMLEYVAVDAPSGRGAQFPMPWNLFATGRPCSSMQ